MSLNLVLAYESSALAAPQSFRDAMQAAANILDSVIQNTITITIQVGYGDWNNGQDTGITTGAEGGDLNGLYESYTTLRSALASHETSALDQTFVNSLPNTSTVNGVSSLWVPSAVGKALGLVSPNGTAVDGAVGMGTQIPTSLLVGVALHELGHAMGREPEGGTFDLLRYTSPGNHLFSTANTAPAAYFSIDGGNTKLADFGQNSDPSDFLNSGVQGPNDPYNEYYSYNTLQSLTSVDIKLLDALGFNTTPGPITTVIESFGSTTLTQVGNSIFLYASTGSGPSVKFYGSNYVVSDQPGTFAPIGAEANTGGYEIAWKVIGADIYTVWQTDGNGNYISNIGNVSGSSYALESIETSFHQDLNGDGVIGLPTTVIHSDGTTNLTQVGDNVFLYASNGSGPSVKFYGSNYVVSDQPGTFAPIGAVANTGGYEIAWKVIGADIYTAWQTDGNGNYISNIGNVSGSSYALESIETSFHQDLNGDGTIGLLTTVIHSDGTTNLTQVANNIFLYASNGSGPSVKFYGSNYAVSDQLGTFAPIGAVTNTGGYEIAWKVIGADIYTVWQTDGNGNYISNIGNVSGSSSTLESLETSFHQDLNGDGHIGVVVSARANFAFSPNFTSNTPGTDTIQSNHEVFAIMDALYATAHDDPHGNPVIADIAHDAITIQNVSRAQLLAHLSDFHLA